MNMTQFLYLQQRKTEVKYFQLDLAGRTEYQSILAETIEETTKIIAQVNNPVKIIFFNGQ